MINRRGTNKLYFLNAGRGAHAGVRQRNNPSTNGHLRVALVIERAKKRFISFNDQSDTEMSVSGMELLRCRTPA